MAKAKARAAKKPKKPRVTITMSSKANEHLKEFAAVNQRSVAWIVNYAVDEFLRKHQGNPAQLPVRSSPPGRDED
jgi:hypothetical protein